jgi:hypothetical protein
MLIENTDYDRPRLLASTTTMKQIDIAYTLKFELVADGTRMRWSGEVRPKGGLRLLGPPGHLDGDAPRTANLVEPEESPGRRASRRRLTTH